MRALALLLLGALAGPVAAQNLPGFAPAGSTVAYSTTAMLGVPMPIEGGPWVIGDVRFEGNKTIATYTLENRVHARRGALFTPTDIAGDVAEIAAMPAVSTVTAALYGIPDQPVPDNYRAIAVSTMMVRIVYTLQERAMALPGLAAPPPAAKGAPLKTPPVSISGVVMTPTAYRGIGQYNEPGLGLDFNAIYFIGRLYGKNTVSEHPTNYIDRIGVWNLSADGKMQIQSESWLRPAMAVGAEGVMTFRDAPQPQLQQVGAQPGVTANAKTSRFLGDTYFVVSKKVYKARLSAGYEYGNAADRIALLSEFLSPQSLQASFGGTLDSNVAKSKDMPFASVLFLPKPSYPLAVEVMKPQGMPRNPVLFNFKLGYFLKLNFDLSYLRFQGGWDLLGQFAFRFTYFPRTVPAGFHVGD